MRDRDLENGLVVTGGRVGGRIVRELGMDLSTLLYLKWITNKDLLQSTGNSAQCYVAAWMEGKFWGRIDTCVCMAEPLHCSPELSHGLLISYSPIQNKKYTF